MSHFEDYIPRVDVNDISYTTEYLNEFCKPLGRDHPDAPKEALTPKMSPKGRLIPHVSNYDEATKTVYIQAYDSLVSQVSLSTLIGEFRQGRDGVVIAFVNVTIEHRGIVTGQNVITLEKIGFVRDKIGEFTFTYDYANPRRKPDFTPVEEKPEPESWDSWEFALKSIRERQTFCEKNNIWFSQRELDHALWLESKIAEEKAWLSSPEVLKIEDEIRAAQAAVDAHAASMKSGKS